MATYATIRELQLNARRVLEATRADGDCQAVITSRGKPVAVLVPVGPGELDDVRRSIRSRRLLGLAASLARDADAAGSAGMSMEQVDREIAASRRAARRNGRR